MNATLVPSAVASMSTCLVDLVDTWFADIEPARHATRDGFTVLDIGVPREHVGPLLEDIADGGWDVAAGIVPERLTNQVPVAAGTPLGYELVGYDSGIWHSWLCLGGLVEAVHDATGVRPGGNALISDHASADRAARWLTGSGLGDPSGWPGGSNKVFYWVPALLTVPVAAIRVARPDRDPLH